MEASLERKLRVELGSNLRRARREAELTQGKLADMLGVDQPQISKWEGGRTLPTILQLIDLAIACRRRPETLIEGLVAPTREQLSLALDASTSALLYEVTRRLAGKTGDDNAQPAGR